MRLNAIRFGASFGVAWGLGMLIMAWCSWWFGWATPVVELFASAYIGYAASFWGGVIGFLWGFLDFFIFG